jgi:DNA ligase-1
VLDETGRWALIKLVTGALRIGVSARLAKAAVAAMGATDAQDIELLWPGLSPPYVELFAWLEGRGEKPASGDPAAFRPAMLAHALDEPELATLVPADFLAEWKWDGIRVQAVTARQDDKNRRGHFQELSRSHRCAAASRRHRRRTFDYAPAPRAIVQRVATTAQS